MALAGRTTRRGGGRRWIVLGVVITLVVLLVDASVKSRSPGPVRRLASQEWVDRVDDIVGSSNVAGKDLAGFLDSTATVDASRVTSRLTSMASAAHSAYASYAKLGPPAGLTTAAGLLETCLALRARATASISRAVRGELAAPGSAAASSGAASRVAGALGELEVADQAYRLFVDAVPSSLDAPAPASQWVRASEEAETTATLTVFLTGLRARVSLKPVYGLAIEAVSTTPPALGTRQGVETITAAPDLTVAVVVGNTGNGEEDDLTVSASISPAVGTASAREYITALAPGTARTVTVGALNPPQGETVALTVTVAPLPGALARTQTVTLRFEMPSTSSRKSTKSKRSTGSTTTVPASGS